MAAPITHIVQANRVYDKHFSNKLRKEFFIGTCFPDIRLMGVIEEEKTHFNNLSLGDIRNKTAFWAGVKFHSMVDNLRKEFIVESNIYNFLPKNEYVKVSLKLLEDEIYYKKINDWSVYADYMNEILPEEKILGIREKDIKNWHNIIINYLSKKPDDNSRMQFHLSMGVESDLADNFNKNIVTLKSNKEAILCVENFHDYILKRLESN
jgi:hypothetical protein